MAEGEKFSLAKLVDFSPLGWYKVAGIGIKAGIVVLILIGCLSLWRFFFPAADKQINRPRTYVLPGAKVDKIDQSNVQVLLEEKKWAISLGGGALRWDNRDGAFAGFWVTRKW